MTLRDLRRCKSSDHWRDDFRHVADLVVGIPGEGPDAFTGFSFIEGPLGAGAIGVFLGESGSPDPSRIYQQASLGTD